MSEGSTLQSVTNTLRLLEAFSVNEPELGVAELSRKLDLGKSTVFRMIATLEERGYLAQNPVTGKYRLGLTVVHLGGLALGQMNLVREAQPFLEEITRRTGEAALLAVLYEGHSTYINKVESPHPLRLSAAVGSRLPAYATATGRVLLAHLSKVELERYLNETQFTRFTEATMADAEALRERLGEIRKTGYAQDKEQYSVGLTSVAAPIRDAFGRVIAAMSAAGPLIRLQDREEELKEVVITTAEALSRTLGWNP